MSPLMQKVEQAGWKGMRLKREPWRITKDLFFNHCEELRRLFARLINEKNPQNIAIIPAVSYGLASIAKNLPLHGDKKNIIVAGEQFPSNVYPWRRLSQENNCNLKTIEPPSTEDRGKKWNQQILEAIDNETQMVAIGNVHWADGTLFDLEAIAKRTRDVDAYLVIDGTQSVGALPLDVEQIRPDALFCAGYKWLMGPYSITLGCYGPRFRDGIPLEEGWIVRKNSEDFTSLVEYKDEYQSGALRYDMGERSNFILIPMMSEALKQVLRWGPANIQSYCEELTSELIDVLPDVGCRVEEAEWRSHHLFGIRLPSSVATHDLEKACMERNIYVSIRGAAVRVSPNVYNEQEDISKLSELLKDFTERSL